ncbi:hypothetical protein MES4922_40362 [Mesorhizobium ventifaucium]|uniref:Uncharacterized protein n=1 Tax=Mesorhizobium ventifaucium TaxID=666020 RepID=A0ABN8K5W6_9HYPH|nr:hypothetical protein MES4922_40362 [Mesorhizobium ventifaucium]
MKQADSFPFDVFWVSCRQRSPKTRSTRASDYHAYQLWYTLFQKVQSINPPSAAVGRCYSFRPASDRSLAGDALSTVVVAYASIPMFETLGAIAPVSPLGSSNWLPHLGDNPVGDAPSPGHDGQCGVGARPSRERELSTTWRFSASCARHHF